MAARGKAILVGAGPGDPGLATLKAVEALRQADVVIYDALANERLLSHVRPDAELIFAGKRGPSHALEQTEINVLIIEAASQGKTVVRLKGGDPFLFGRGGEEAEALALARIPFEVVPGVTSAIAVPAYAGIPVTHRDYSSSFAVVSGRGAEGGEVQVDWKALAGIDTVAFLMGVSNLEEIVRRLTEAGRPGGTPVAVIAWGTRPGQRTVVGTLHTIVEKVRAAGLGAPAVTVVGEVVRLRERLSWFEERPLFGRRILVTRSREQASELSRRLEAEGAEAVEFPTIEIRPPTSWKLLDRAISRVDRYDWLIFTSVNGVASFFGRLQSRGRDLRDLKGIRIAAIGPATAQAISQKGIGVESIAEEYRAEGLVKILAAKKLRGKKVLIPRARQAREVLTHELKRLGAKVEVVEAYRAVPPQGGAEELRRLVEEKKIDLITFASSSTVENFMKLVGTGPLTEAVRKIPVAVIGPVTADTARQCRLNVSIQPAEYTIPALVEAVAGYFSRSG